MSRFALAFIAAALLALPAQAATATHPSATTKKSEKGVAVWRGPAGKIPAAPRLAGAPKAPCALTVVVVQPAGWPPRRAATHGFWSGAPLSAPYGVATTGFFADRMAAGL
jgi:hypothetical protein